MAITDFSVGKRLGIFAGFMALLLSCTLPAIYWLVQAQSVTDEGAVIVVFNNSAAPVRLIVEETETRLAPRETWRSESLAAGEHTVQIDGRTIVVETALDGAGHLIPVEPVALAIIDTAAEYADLSTGRMMGAEILLISSHDAAEVVRVSRRYTLSPYDTSPPSTYGAPPHQARIIPAEFVGDDARLREFIGRANP